MKKRETCRARSARRFVDSSLHLVAALILATTAGGVTPSAAAGPSPIAGGAAEGDGAAESPEAREVLDTVRAWNRAFARNDAPTYFSYVDDGVTVITPSNPYRIEGVVHDRREFEYMLKLGTGRLGYFQELQPRVQRYGDAAIVTYYSRGSYGPEGKEQTLYFKETDVLVKRPSGWKVVHIHVSKTSAP